jgi:hypothetical protein
VVCGQRGISVFAEILQRDFLLQLHLRMSEQITLSLRLNIHEASIRILGLCHADRTIRFRHFLLNC